MIAHHLCFAGLPKGLDFLASMYCRYYQFWKAESKDWGAKMSEDELWEYNCKDVLYTLEVSGAIDSTIDKLGMRAPFEFQMEMFQTVFRMMLRGVRFNQSLRSELTTELFDEIGKRETLVQTLLGEPVNMNSPKQLQTLFYDQLGQKVIMNRKTGRPTTDDEALNRIAKREPLLRPLVGAINEIRYLRTAMGVIATPVDTDGRMRCSYNLAGTGTFRLSSSEDAFGFGTNLQNWSKGKKSLETGLQMPNTRRLLIPDEGFEIFDADLDRADAQVVAWEADDPILKQMFREGVDIHTENAKTIGCPRQQAKQGVHAANYGAAAKTIAYHLGITVHQADQFLHRWFSAHPQIKVWHKRIEHQLATRRFVINAFGFRRFFFERTDGILPEALAWVPQSTVAITINKGGKALEVQVLEAEILLQVHDSLTFQLPLERPADLIDRCAAALRVTIPYPDPLVIPIGFKRSVKSWGDCE
jgi:DNA polymerase-1